MTVFARNHRVSQMFVKIFERDAPVPGSPRPARRIERRSGCVCAVPPAILTERTSKGQSETR